MITVPLFWCGEGGSVGISFALTLKNDLPPIDLTQITDARIRLQTPAPGNVVSYLVAAVTASTPFSATIRHTLGPSSFTTTGTWRAWAEISLDGGSSWYPSAETSIVVTS